MEVLIIVGETGSGKTTQIPPGASQRGSAGVRFTWTLKNLHNFLRFFTMVPYYDFLM